MDWWDERMEKDGSLEYINSWRNEGLNNVLRGLYANLLWGINYSEREFLVVNTQRYVIPACTFFYRFPIQDSEGSKALAKETLRIRKNRTGETTRLRKKIFSGDVLEKSSLRNLLLSYTEILNNNGYELSYLLSNSIEFLKYENSCDPVKNVTLNLSCLRILEKGIESVLSGGDILTEFNEGMKGMDFINTYLSRRDTEDNSDFEDVSPLPSLEEIEYSQA